MAYFPMCLDLAGRTVLLVGEGSQTADKAEKLRPFGARLRHVHAMTAEDLTADVAFVVVGDTPGAEAARISRLCTERRIPVNVVDMPGLCTFTFPALVCRGDLSIAVSTGGKAPGAAAWLAERIRQMLPARTGEILQWLGDTRRKLYARYPRETARAMLRRLTGKALELGRPLTDGETEA